jgi:NAD(P)-dependent dehydrogenase (short-subunit alcohol dehydrogenase family)
MNVLVITGGSRGIGKSIALNAAKRGVGVILTYNTGDLEASAVVEEVQNNGGKAIALQLDVSKVEGFKGFAAKVKTTLKESFGKETFEFLINNAGISGQREPILETTERGFDELVNVNLKGPYFLTQKLVPFMSDGGHIINISSGLARFAFPNVAVYGSLKCALEGFTRYFAKEFAHRRIRANTVAPGAVDTEFGGGKDVNAKKHLSELTALGKIADAEDIGLFVASLLTDDSRFVNAQRIELSGGFYI